MGNAGWDLVFAALVSFWTASPLAALEFRPADSQRADATTSRVRTEDPDIAQAIAQAMEWSDTFRRLVEAIGRTDGVVWIRQGRCPATFACLLTYLEVAGPHRLLLIHVDPRQRGDRLMASLGHELQHAVEVLGSSARSSAGVYYFFQSYADAHRVGGTFETNEAIRAERAVSREVARARRRPQAPQAGQP